MTTLSLYLATLLMGTNFSASTAPPDAPRARVSVSVSAAEQWIVDLANTERWDRSLPSLAQNPLLTQVAREHSREMWELDYFGHISPTEGMRTPMQRYLQSLGHTPTWTRLGENVFYCSVVDPQLGHRRLMDSAGHRRSILDPRFEQIGVGVFISPDGRFWVTQLFLSQID